MSYKQGDYLQHIQHEIDFLIEVLEKHDVKSFIEDETTTRAVARSFEIIGEATTKMDKSFKENNKNVPWNEMTGFRNVLIHNYIDVDYEVVWDILKNDIPELKIKIDKLLK